MDDCRALFQSFAGLYYNGENLIIHPDLFQSVCGGVLVLRDDDSRRLADIADLFRREDRMLGRV